MPPLPVLPQPLSRRGLILAALAAGCGRRAGEPLTSYIPEAAAAVAFADLNRLRATPLFARLPVPDALRDAAAVLAVFDGRDWAVAAGGDFREMPAGAQRIAPRVVAFGGPELVRAMATRPRGGGNLLAHAPSDAPAWLVTRGGVSLPLVGNLANLNRLLQQAEYTTIALRPAAKIGLDATALCATAERAQHLEENVRALVSLARFEGIDLSREGSTVRVRAAIAPDALPRIAP